MSGNVVQSLPEILPELREALPPALADAIEDERNPNYREHLRVESKLHAREDGRGMQLAIEVENSGSETVTMLALRAVLVDANDMPVRSIVTYAATPLTVDEEWRGPLLPGSTRLCGVFFYRSNGDLTPRVEITDVRTWAGSKSDSNRQAALTMNTSAMAGEPGEP